MLLLSPYGWMLLAVSFRSAHRWQLVLHNIWHLSAPVLVGFNGIIVSVIFSEKHSFILKSGRSLDYGYLVLVMDCFEIYFWKCYAASFDYQFVSKVNIIIHLWNNSLKSDPVPLSKKWRSRFPGPTEIMLILYFRHTVWCTLYVSVSESVFQILLLNLFLC